MQTAISNYTHVEWGEVVEADNCSLVALQPWWPGSLGGLAASVPRQAFPPKY